MDKLKMQSENLVNKNISYIAEKFPNCITEGKNGKGETIKLVDFDLLKQELSSVIVEGNDERYVLNWAGKKQSILTANAPISATLRPCKNESVDKNGTKGQILDEKTGKQIDNPSAKFDSENLYIEGDNLDVLKLLRETYLNKVKMIYIDPPYNTGHDFVYEDDFATSTEEYLQNSKSFDEQGNRMFQNNDSNGRFHSDWLSMIYSRLKLAKDLLTDDGVIFISIDDNEQENLKKVCNEIFGESNFVAQFIWQKNFAPKNDNKYISVSHEYIFLYSKKKSNFNRNLLPRTAKNDEGYSNPDNDKRGPWASGTMLATTFSKSGVFEIISPNGIRHLPPVGRCWRYSKTTLEELIKDNRIYWGAKGMNVPRVKRFLAEMPNGIVPQTLLKYEEVGSNQDGTQVLKSVFGETIVFDFPKPLKLIKRLIYLATNKDNLILDFFSGSATTAHAVMQLNAEDGGNRKFIMVQLPELTSEDSEAYKAGYKNICEIGKERIRRAGDRVVDWVIREGVSHRSLQKDIKNNPTAKFNMSEIDWIESEEHKIETAKMIKDLDIGFRCLKLDSSCMKDVYYNPSEVSQDLLSKLESNIKEDRKTEDLLFQVMLDMGVLLSSKIEERKMQIENGKLKIIDNTEFGKLNETEKKSIKTIYIVGDYDIKLNEQPNLICCFDENLTEEIMTEIAKMKPLYAVFRDSGMATDSVAVNFDQIFATYSPTTTRKVL